MTHRRPWPGGGYVRREEDGRETWVIERRVGTHRFHISTRAHSEKAAYEHLRRFEADPHQYAEEMQDEARDSGGAYLSDELIEEFGEWLMTRQEPPPVTVKHGNEMEARLADWADDLRGQDLRHVDLATYKLAANKRRSRQHRIIAIKSFCTWLRQEKFLLTRQNDATLDLEVPQGVPEKYRRQKAVEVERVRAALRHLAPAYRDCLLVLSRTGWHVTELARFARHSRHPDSAIRPAKDGALCVLQVLHKSRVITRTPIMEPEAAEAAQRVWDRGCLPRRMNATLKSACLAARVEPFTFGLLRPTVITWAVEMGESREHVADFVDHANTETTNKFYVRAGIPKRPLRLPSLT